MRDVNEPRWVRVIALGSALALASFGAVGLLLADLGVYSLPLALVLGIAAFALLYRWARPVLETDGTRARTGAERLGAELRDRRGRALHGQRDLERVQRVATRADQSRRRASTSTPASGSRRHGTLNLQPFVGPVRAVHSVARSSRSRRA